MGGRKALVITVATAVVALVVGLGIGRASAPEQTDAAKSRLATSEATAENLRAENKILSKQRDEASERASDLEDRAKDLKQREAEVAAAEKSLEARTVEGDGTYIVGQDVKAGVYKTSGPNDDYDSCYYAVHPSPSKPSDFVTNGNISGTGVVSLSNGQMFESKRCDSWVRQK